MIRTTTPKTSTMTTNAYSRIHYYFYLCRSRGLTTTNRRTIMYNHTVLALRQLQKTKQQQHRLVIQQEEKGLMLLQNRISHYYSNILRQNGTSRTYASRSRSIPVLNTITNNSFKVTTIMTIRTKQQQQSQGQNMYHHQQQLGIATTVPTIVKKSESAKSDDNNNPFVLFLCIATAAMNSLICCNNNTKTSTTSCEEKKNNSTFDNTGSSTHDKSQPPLRKCGYWCNDKEFCSTKCQIDKTIIPCDGDLCTTTCGLWSKLTLPSSPQNTDNVENKESDIIISNKEVKNRQNDNITMKFACNKHGKKQQRQNGKRNRPVIPCELYQNGLAYVPGAEPCDPSCLPKELRKERYPLPTGVGMLCIPGTCRPTAHAAKLQCPCNWFSSSCTDDWIPVRRIVGITNRSPSDNTNNGTKTGSLLKSSSPTSLQSSPFPPIVVKLHVTPTDWYNIVENYRPGSVLRVTQRDDNSVPRDAVTALILPPPVLDDYDSSRPLVGELEILLGYPDQTLHAESRMVSERLYNMIRYERGQPTTTDTAIEQSVTNDSDATRNATKTTSTTSIPHKQKNEQLVVIDNPSNLYVTPVLSGFCNKNYTYLDDFLSSSNANETILSNSPSKIDNNNTDDDEGDDEDDDSNKKKKTNNDRTTATSSSRSSSISKNKIEHMIVVTSGVGIGGALSAAEVAPKDCKVHLYYGVRTKNDLSLVHSKERLERLIALGKIANLTIITSNNTASDEGGSNSLINGSRSGGNIVSIKNGIQRGEQLKEEHQKNAEKKKKHDLISPASKLKTTTTNKTRYSWWNSFISSSSKLYVQHAFGSDLFDTTTTHDCNGDENDARTQNTTSTSSPCSSTTGKSYLETHFGVTLQKSIIVICGRSEVLLDMENILKNAIGTNNNGSSENEKDLTKFLNERVFTNV